MVVGTHKPYPTRFHLHLGGSVLTPTTNWWTTAYMETHPKHVAKVGWMDEWADGWIVKRSMMLMVVTYLDQATPPKYQAPIYRNLQKLHIVSF